MGTTTGRKTQFTETTDPVGKSSIEPVITEKTKAIDRQKLEQSIKQNTKLLKHTVNILNVIQKGRNDGINNLAKEIRTKIREGIEQEIQCKSQEVTFKITKQPNDEYDIEFLNTDNCSDKTLKSLQGLKLTVQKKDREYKFGARFGEGAKEFRIGGLNKKLPRPSQVSALEYLMRPLVLIATATGSGKTITKLMFALAARLSGMKVVSVDSRGDLVPQEYREQEGAVLFNSTSHISHNNQHEDKKDHHILSLDRFFAASNKILNLDKLSQLLKKHNAENEGFKVDLKKKKITIGKNIEIYQDHYKVNGIEFEGSIFDTQNLLVMLDEIQDMVNQGHAYSVEIDLLLLLASWKKINLVVTTATPTKNVLDFIKEEKKNENAHIEAQSLKEKIALGIGGTTIIEARKNLTPKQSVTDYVKYRNSEILERSEGEDYYYDHNTDKEADIGEQIRKHITWNLQSLRNRMTLVCSDCHESTKLLKEKILSPEQQIRTLYSEEHYDFNKKIHNKCDFYLPSNCGNLSESIRDKLIDTFGAGKEAAINEALKEYDLTSGIADDPILTVTHGLINNFISCVTGVPLYQLNKERFSGHEILQEDGSIKTISLLDHFKDAFAKTGTGGIPEYIASVLKIEDHDAVNNLRKGMEIVGGLFEKYENDPKKLDMLVSNHNLSREIHEMIPPNFSNLDENIVFEIFNQSRDYRIFKYLESNYGLEYSQETQNEFTKLYKAWKDANEIAVKYKRENVDSVLEKCGSAPEAQKVALLGEYNKGRQTYLELAIEADRRKRELVKKFNKVVDVFQNDDEKYPLRELRPICIKLADVKNNSECLSDELSQASVRGVFFKGETSGFDNKNLYNVLIIETIKDDPKRRQQGVGRTGRENGPIISSSYVSSSKISNPDKTKDQLENGSPIEMGETEKGKIDLQEFAKRMTERMEEIISAHHSEGESGIADRVIEFICSTYRELHKNEEYKNGKTHKALIQTLQNVTSALKKECKKNHIIVGDSIPMFNIRGIESKITNVLDELMILSGELEPYEKNRDKINEKLKIESNFLKRLIIELWTLVVHLWHWRLNPTEQEVSEVMNKEDALTFKDRVILRKARTKVEEEMKPLEKKRKRKEDEKIELTNKRIKFQNEYNEKNRCVGVPIPKGKNGEQKEITESEKNSIVKRQLSGIEEELNTANRSLNEFNKKHGKDLEAFETQDLKGKIGNLGLIINGPNGPNGLKSELEKVIETQDKLTGLAQTLHNVQEILQGNRDNIELHCLNYYDNSRKKIESLQETTKKIEGIISEEYKDFFNKEDSSRIKRHVAKLYSLCKECLESQRYKENNNIQKEAKELEEALEEIARHIKIMPQERDLQKSVKEYQEIIENYKNQTQIEKLCDLVYKGIDNHLNGNKEQITSSDAKRLLLYINQFTEEKTRLEKLQGEQARLVKRIEDLGKEEREWKNSDSDKQTDVSKRISVYKSITKNYDLKCFMWLFQVFPDFVEKVKNLEDYDSYISSTEFLELFTNIVVPLMDKKGPEHLRLKALFDVMEPDSNNSEEKVKRITKFHENLVNRNFDEIEPDDVTEALGHMEGMFKYIMSAKINHYTNGLKKDCELIKNITFGKLDLAKVIGERLGGNSDSNEVDPVALLQQLFVKTLNDKNIDIAEALFATQGIRTDIDSGTTIFSSIKFAATAFPFILAKFAGEGKDFLDRIITTFADTSVQRAQRAMEHFGEPKDQGDITKYVSEMLTIFLKESRGCGDKITWSENPTVVEMRAQIFQKLGQAARSESKKEELTSTVLTNPNSSCVNNLDLWVQSVKRQMQQGVACC